MRAGFVLFVLSLSAVLSQAAPFENLGFDSANTNRVTAQGSEPLRGVGPAEDLLPGWQLSKGGQPQETLGLNLSLLSSGYATLISADQSDFYNFAVEGKYALHLIGSPGNQEPFSLSQRGDIPFDARFLSFKYSGYSFLVTIDRQIMLPVDSTSETQVFDISSFRGETVDMTLTALGPLMPTQTGSSYIDSIALIVPEPSSWLLFACGLASVLAGSRWRRRL